MAGPHHDDPSRFARRLRLVVPLDEEHRIDELAREAECAMWQRVAETMPDMSIAAVMERWAQDIAALPRAEQLRVAQEKRDVLAGLGYDAEALVDGALARAERLADQALLVSHQASCVGGVRRG
jgi:hypothetical protein